MPGLEAMANRCPVVCSDILVLKEIYNDAAVYFNPLNSKDIAEKIKNVISGSRREDMIRKGEKIVKKYSWSKMASETLRVYNSV